MKRQFFPIVNVNARVLQMAFFLVNHYIYCPSIRSNFNRLNYSTFFTAILERGDEIVCAASIRYVSADTNTTNCYPQLLIED